MYPFLLRYKLLCGVKVYLKVNKIIHLRMPRFHHRSEIVDDQSPLGHTNLNSKFATNTITHETEAAQPNKNKNAASAVIM